MNKGFILCDECFKDCLKNGKALCAFNFSNLEVLKCILQSAEENNSPVIAQASESAINHIGGDYLKSIISTVKKKVNVPVIFHLDHGSSLKACKDAISLGFDSVMIDASSKTFDENVKITKSVCDYAHKKNVWVEAELGSLSGIEDDVKVDCSNAKFTDPKQAKEFVKLSGCDSLAVAIGTSHGAYKFKGESKLRMDILSQIEKNLGKYPLVLHGASSVSSENVENLEYYGGELKSAKGVDEDILYDARKNHNVCKINIDTDLRIAYTAGIRKVLLQNKSVIDQRKYVTEGCNFVKEVLNAKLKLLSI